MKPVRALHGRQFDVYTAEHERRRAANDDLRAERALLAAQISAATEVGMKLVYAVLRAEAPLVKIGASRRLAGREGRLRRMTGCTLVAIAPGGHEAERQAHHRLAAHRVWADLPGYGYGEHFAICDDVLEWINETRHAINLPSLEISQIMSQYGG